jgi:hypothetical protein
MLFCSFIFQNFWLRGFTTCSVVFEQMTLAPRAVYTRGDDTKQKFANELATDRTPLLVDEQMNYANGCLDIFGDGDLMDGPLPPCISYVQNAGKDGALQEVNFGDPLTGKLFGQSSREQIMSSWFW